MIPKHFLRHIGKLFPILVGILLSTTVSASTEEEIIIPAPVLPGFTADPHITAFGTTFCLYPTTDIKGWDPKSFHGWTSKDLKTWKDEGVILEIPTDVTWATGQAWAPAIATKNGKYYFYFSANQNIGVAVSDHPMKRFKDALGKPMVAKGEYPCQAIDPMVFVDDDGTPYLFFGQGSCQAVKLNEDMISYDSLAVKKIELEGYNEGAFVFKRKGIYYLSWSEYDTRDPRYSVAYATSKNPLGPYQRAKNNPILQQQGEIKAAGHHSILQLPGSDHWVVAYHRFLVPQRPGVLRETCISPLRFDAQGAILPVNVYESISTPFSKP